MSKRWRAQIDDFGDLYEKQAIGVVVDSMQDVLEGAQTSQPGVQQTGGTFETGKIPVETRSLLQSLELGYNGAYVPTQGSVTLSAAQFNLGDTINARWTAEYALAMEQGFTTRSGTNVPGRHFVGENAAKFSQFVEKNAALRRV